MPRGVSSVLGRLKTVTVNGVALAWTERGEGEPVVLVHGGASDVRTWEGQIERLSARFRVIAYSRRYARPNAPIDPGADDPMFPHVDDLAELTRAVGAAPAHLVGHSWGGFVCLLAAIRRREVVRTLVLLEPPVLTLFVSMPPRPRELLRLFLTRPWTALAIVQFGIRGVVPAQRAFRRGDDEGGLRAFARGVLGPRTWERLSPERRRQAFENLAPDRAQLLGAGFPPLDEGVLRTLRVPTLLMNGASSPRFWRPLMSRLSELLPNCERVEIPAASHLMHEQDPQTTTEAIISFLSRHTGRR